MQVARNFSIHSNANASLFESFWERCRSDLELETRVGTHHRIYAG